MNETEELKKLRDQLKASGMDREAALIHNALLEMDNLRGEISKLKAPQTKGNFFPDQDQPPNSKA
jgi:hypothetical protein